MKRISEYICFLIVTEIRMSLFEILRWLSEFDGEILQVEKNWQIVIIMHNEHSRSIFTRNINKLPVMTFNKF